MVTLLLIIIYLAFIGLGLPDSVFGSAWPIMHADLNVDISMAGIVSMIISVGTVISSLYSDTLMRKLTTSKVTAISTLMTGISLLGFSMSDTYWMICLWSIPYGLGAGSIDAALNNFVALHFESKHMSWLHCMWGVGASLGPFIMGYVLTHNGNWHGGYSLLAIMQITLALILFISLPMWNIKQRSDVVQVNRDNYQPLKFKDIMALQGAKAMMVTFFCYCALELTIGLWASSYLTEYLKVDATKAATLASIFVVGITIGRAISGFISLRLNDHQLIYLGMGIILIGIIGLLLTKEVFVSCISFVVIGFGCAPIYPCIIHSTPSLFGADKSQAMIGIEMASAYVGNTIVPPLFGFMIQWISIRSLPIFSGIILVIMLKSYRQVLTKTNRI